MALIKNGYTYDGVKKKFEDKSLISERTDFDFEVKEYPEMLLDLFHFMNVNVELYEHYIQNR